MAREPILAAGGIVLRREQPPRIAVVRLRKRDEWVLPKGKLNNGETPRAAAEREVLEETGHDVTVHEFLGTLAYESGGRSKIVHYWRMEADGKQAYELMDDVRAVDWLPLDVAVDRLSRGYERAFLANVGPYALENAALAAASRRSKVKVQAAKKRRSRPASAPKPAPAEQLPAPLQAEMAVLPPASDEHLPALDEQAVLACDDAAGIELAADDAVDEAEAEIAALPEDLDESELATESDDADIAEPADGDEAFAAEGQGRSLAQKVKAWLRRAA